MNNVLSMMENMSKLTVLLSIIVLISCSNSNRIQDEQAIMEVINQQSQAWNRGDVEGYMQGYWKSEKLRFASGDKVTYGWQQTLDNYLKSYPSKAKMGELIFSEIKIEILNENEALVFGHWKLNREADNPQGLFTLHFHNFAYGWKIVSDHTS